MVNIVKVAPPGESAPPTRAIPATVRSTGAPPSSTVTWSPTDTSASSATPLSRTTSSSLCGPSPATNVQVLRTPVGQLLAKVGWPALGLPSGSPSLSRTWAIPNTSGLASATPSTAATSSSSEASKRPRSSPNPLGSSNDAGARTTASVVA